MKEIRNPLPTGSVLHGKSSSYIIEKPIGQGAFGTTYLATAKMRGALGTIDVKVAVKEFFMREVNGRNGSTVTVSSNDGVFANYEKKFRAEAKNLSNLDHPHIIKVLEMLEENNTSYYVMEYIDGGSLEDYIASVGTLSEDVVLTYVSQIGEALQFMHRHNMLHLDVKPANIMRRSDGTLVLIDFGLSKQFNKNGDPDSSSTIGGGTPGYAPIEQATYQRGDGLPVTMDVYALGATMYKMLVGERPPNADVILNDGFPRAILESCSVSRHLIDVVAKAMSPTKKDRFQTVEELQKALLTKSVSYQEKKQSDEVTLIREIIIHDTTSYVVISYFPIFWSHGCGKAYMAGVNKYCCDVNITQESTHPYTALNEEKYFQFLSVLRSFNFKRKSPPDHFNYEYSESPEQLEISLYDENGRRYERLEIAGMCGSQWGNIEGDVSQISNRITRAIPGMLSYLKSPYYEIPCLEHGFGGFGKETGNKQEERDSDPAPIYKRLWFWVVAGVIAIAGAGIGISSMVPHRTAKATIGTSTYTPRVTTYTVNGVSFQMVEVEGGTFTMGATSEQGSDAWDDEKPVHRVTLSSYSIGETEVTQALWQAVMGSNPSYFKGDNLPVEDVSWDDCQTFIRKLNQLTGRSFRLPTEAEWEYAARGGSKSRGYKYSGSDTPDNVAWYDDNSGSKTHPVKGKSPNELGLYDMSGNVWEWCQDWYGSYSSGSQTNPTGPNSGSCRVDRGGGWDFIAGLCRASCRLSLMPDDRIFNLGLRLVLSE